MELTKLAGIGKRRESELKSSGIFSAEDLLNTFPYKYYDFSKTEPFCDDGKVRLIFATVIENPKIVAAKRNLTFITCKMTDEVGHKFSAMWFNQTYVKSQLFLGEQLYLYGKNSPTKKNTFIVTLFKKFDKLKSLGFLPIYHKVGDIGQTILQNAISNSLELVKIESIIPQKLQDRYGLMDLSEAYGLVHQPKLISDAISGRSRIDTENMLSLFATCEFRKQFFHTVKPHRYNFEVEALDEFKRVLPYHLTSDQINVLGEITTDLHSKFSMNRLLQGDVGCGKTVVALFGAYLAAKNSLQSAIIAPTEILAQQHYETAVKLFSNKNITDLSEKIVLITGSVTLKEKRIIMEKIESGEALIVIGTHSVISASIKFKNLAYIVIDEQHRFGVEQRKLLADKGFSPDILVMSATPIPRSLNLIFYGDLELSQIKSRPKPNNVQTNIISPQKQSDMWNFIEQRIGDGSKVFVVCSKIDSENDDESVLQYSANNIFKLLSKRFGKNVGIIHGELSKASQVKTLEMFESGEIKILVSTTIIEVGVDVPDCDIMVIATPERFGLATLHQLRGRIGRNGQKSYCFCLGDFLSDKSAERIKFFRDNNDGFLIADYDLKSRGAGTIYGTSQHGTDIDFSANFSTASYSTAKQIFEELKKYPNILARLIEIGESKYKMLSNKNIIFN